MPGGCGLYLMLLQIWVWIIEFIIQAHLDPSLREPLKAKYSSDICQHD